MISEYVKTLNIKAIDIENIDIREVRNILIIDLTIYVIAAYVILEFEIKIMKLASAHVPLMSYDWALKIGAILFLIILIVILIVSGPIRLTRDICAYIDKRNEIMK